MFLSLFIYFRSKTQLSEKWHKKWLFSNNKMSNLNIFIILYQNLIYLRVFDLTRLTFFRIISDKYFECIKPKSCFVQRDGFLWPFCSMKSILKIEILVSGSHWDNGDVKTEYVLTGTQKEQISFKNIENGFHIPIEKKTKCIEHLANENWKLSFFYNFNFCFGKSSFS